MFKNISFLRGKNRVALIVVLALIFWIVAGLLWYSKLYMNNERRFWAAIENGLKTTSIAKEVKSSSPTAEQTQYSRLRLGSQAVVEGRTSITQRSNQTSSTVATSNIVTPTESFIRYDEIKTNEKNQAGKEFDFSSVIGQWAEQNSSNPDEQLQRQAFAESFVQLIPIGNLERADRSEVMKALKSKNAYEVDFGTVTDDEETGFTVYNVTLHTKAYVEVLRDILGKQGFAELVALDPDQYGEDATLSIQISIDGSNSVRRVSFGDGQYESYSDYGITEPVKLPESTVTFEELQNKLQAAQ